MRSFHVVLPALALAFCAACGSEDTAADTPSDTSTTDTATDAATGDTGEDTATTDTAATDTATGDGGDDTGDATPGEDAAPDADPVDTGDDAVAPDVGEDATIDASPDAEPDTSLPDVGEDTSDPDVGDDATDPDVGEPDAGTACTWDRPATCGEGRWCEVPDGQCGDNPVSGTCAARPEGCPRIYDPVCGCDGETYSNDCIAAAAGVNIDSRGECDGGGTDGCVSNGECDRGQFCHFETGTCAAPGVCEARPRGCPDVYDPVCGCDGTTYGNECEASAAGVSVASAGACRDPGGCNDNEECPLTSYCAFAPLSCAGPGDCEPRPEACPAIYDPVCGCDGRTYSNGCVAASSGANVASRGACP